MHSCTSALMGGTPGTRSTIFATLVRPRLVRMWMRIGYVLRRRIDAYSIVLCDRRRKRDIREVPPAWLARGAGSPQLGTRRAARLCACACVSCSTCRNSTSAGHRTDCSVRERVWNALEVRQLRRCETAAGPVANVRPFASMPAPVRRTHANPD
eukprot:COSAG01_NODE_5959_length_3933_cov_4.771838_3_plen_154_part_00